VALLGRVLWCVSTFFVVRFCMVCGAHKCCPECASEGGSMLLWGVGRVAIIE